MVGVGKRVSGWNGEEGEWLEWEEGEWLEWGAG